MSVLEPLRLASWERLERSVMCTFFNFSFYIYCIYVCMHMWAEDSYWDTVFSFHFVVPLAIRLSVAGTLPPEPGHWSWMYILNPMFCRRE